MLIPPLMNSKIHLRLIWWVDKLTGICLRLCLRLCNCKLCDTKKTATFCRLPLQFHFLHQTKTNSKSKAIKPNCRTNALNHLHKYHANLMQGKLKRKRKPCFSQLPSPSGYPRSGRRSLPTESLPAHRKPAPRRFGESGESS